MFKKFYLLTLVFIFSGLVFGVEPILEYPLPDFVINNPYFSSSPLDKYIQVGIFSDNSKVLSFSGYKKSRNSVLQPFSRIIFLNSQNKVKKELNFKSHVKTITINNIPNPIVAVTFLKIQYDEYYPDKINVYSLKGEFLCTIPNNEHNYVYSSMDNNFLCLVDLMDGLAGSFTFIPIKTLNIKDKNSGILPKYTLTFSGNPAEHWILLGEEPVSLIYSTGATLKKISLKNKGETQWKIPDLGNNINLLKLLMKHFIAVEAYPYFYIIDEKTGTILKSINLKNNQRIKAVVDSHNFTITKNLNLVENKKTITPTLHHSSILKSNEKTYFFAIKNKNLLIFEN